jgi:hypothetical protein
VSAASLSLGTSPQRFDAVESPAWDDQAAERSADDLSRPHYEASRPHYEALADDFRQPLSVVVAVAEQEATAGRR